MIRLASTTALLALLLAAGSAAASENDGEDPFEFRSRMSAAQETGEPASDGKGKTRVRFSRKLSSVRVEVEVKNLVGDVNDAHLHCALAGQDGPIILRLSPKTGVTDDEIVDARFFNSDLDAADCTTPCGFPVNNMASLRFAAERGCLYVNVHTTFAGPGEVRGQLLPDD